MRALPIYPDGRPRLLIEDVQARAKQAVEKCTLCSLGENVATNCMDAEQVGPESGPTLLVVLPPPAKLDDTRGSLVGSTTVQYLTKLLTPQWAGPIVFDSAVRCAPGLRKATPAHYAACRGYGLTVLREAAPDRVLLMGAEACQAYLGVALPVMSMQRGQVLLSTGVPVFFTPWPLAALRNILIQRQFEATVKWALTATPRRVPAHAVALQVVTAEDAEEAYEELTAAGGATIDVETFGLAFNCGQKILSLAATPVGNEISYVWGVDALRDPLVTARLRELLQDGNFPKRGTNFKFDTLHLQAFFGVHVDGVDGDAMIFRKLMQADASASLHTMQTLVGMYGGKQEVEEHVKFGAAELKRLAKKGGESTAFAHSLTDDELQYAVGEVVKGADPLVFAYAAIPPDVRDRYNASDAISTDKVVTHLHATGEPHAHDVWATIVRDLHHGITQMQFNGIRVDRSRIADLRSEMEGTIASCEEYLAKAHGELNVNSTAQVGKLLFETLGCRLGKNGRTATGKYKVTAEVMDGLVHPTAKVIQELKRAGKFKSQYADGMEGFIQDDGRIHPDINITGTATGRPSCSSPNLMNIPRTSGAGKKCRSIFVPSEGWEFIEGDYNQLELRVAAFLSADPLMIDIFQRNVDYHTETAKLIAPLLGIDASVVTKDHPIRDQAKTVNFAFLYGDSAAGIGAKLGISTTAATKLVGAILGQFSTLAAWVKRRIVDGNYTGVARTWWDGRDFRVRPLPAIAGQDEDERATAERSTYNTAVQGTGADFMNATIGRMQRLIDGAAKNPALLAVARGLCERHGIRDVRVLRGDPLPVRQVLTVYDSLLAEVDPGFADDYVRLLRGVAVSWNSGPVPMRMDFKRGFSSWGELEKST